MPDHNKYGDFFEKYSPERNVNASPRTDRGGSNRYTQSRKKRKRKKNRFLRLSLFLLPYLLGLAAVITVIALLISLIGKAADKKDSSYTALTVSETASTETEDAQVPTLFMPATTDSTVSLGSVIDSEHAVLVDCSTGNVLAQKAPDTRIYPASMTKIMTLLVAAENVISLDATFTMTSEIIDPLYREGSTLAGFMPNEEVRIEDLFYGAILESGGEATVGLAIHIAGSEEEFVKMMNQKAAELGLKNTNFCNSSGLHDENHYTTSREMAIIMQAVLNNEFCRKVISTEYYTVAANELREELNFHSGMFTRMYGTEPEVATIKGGKTGYTVNSANCLVSYAVTDDGREIICVTAEGGGKYVPIYDSIELYKNYTH